MNTTTISGDLSAGTTEDDFEPEEDYGQCIYKHHGAYFLPVLYALVFMLGILGNTLVIWVMVAGVRLRSMTDVCLLNLAVADLLLASSLPFLAHQARDQWVFGSIMCKAVLGIYHVGFYTGIFFITLMSIDRYLAIVHAILAMRARTRSFGIAAAVVTWLAGILASFPEIGFLQVQESPKLDSNIIMYCAPVYVIVDGTTARHWWSIFALYKMSILGLLIPIAIMAFCYSQIIWRLLSSQFSKKPAIRLVIVVMLVFFCCWVPYNVAALFKALELTQGMVGDAACERSKAIRTALQATAAIAYCHTCLNPILYVFVGEKFRVHLVRLIHRSPCKLCPVSPLDRLRGSVYSQTTILDERASAM